MKTLRKKTGPLSKVDFSKVTAKEGVVCGRKAGRVIDRLEMVGPGRG